MNRFTEFNHYRESREGLSRRHALQLPINLFTLYQVFGVRTPEAARERLAADIVPNDAPANMEEYCSP